jgi:1,4-dihydroxy-2-naphthoyl-CoA hydrolase
METIWFNKNITLDDLKRIGQGTMSAHIGIEWQELGKNTLKATMPVDHRTQQPYGFLHGGASCVLAETLGSVAAHLVIDEANYLCVGLEINANHIRIARKGLVTGICSPIHIGSSTQVWDIKIYDENQKLICISRLTVAVLKKTV